MGMVKNTQWKSIRKYSVILKFLLGAIICFVLFENLTNSPEKKQRLLSLVNPVFLSSYQKNLLTLVVILMPINWIIETIKWKYASKKIYRLSFINALKGTLSGLSISFLFPNRTGDFAGRLLFFPSNKRLKGLTASIMVSFAQLAVMLCLGSIATLFLINKNLEAFQFSLEMFYIIFLAIITITLLSYFYSHKIGLINIKSKRLKRPLKFLKVFRLFDNKTKRNLFLLSLFRYLIFCFQFALLIAFFTNNFHLDFLIFAPASFFITTIIPSLTFAELGVREWVNFTFSDYFGIDQQAAVMSGLALWFINVLAPAVIGIFLIFNAKFFKD